MTDYDDMMRELPDDIMNDIHAYYYRDLPYLDELNRVNQVIIDYEGLSEVYGNLFNPPYARPYARFERDNPDAQKLEHCFYKTIGYTPLTVLKLILNRECGDYKLGLDTVNVMTMFKRYSKYNRAYIYWANPMDKILMEGESETEDSETEEEDDSE